MISYQTCITPVNAENSILRAMYSYATLKSFIYQIFINNQQKTQTLANLVIIRNTQHLRHVSSYNCNIFGSNKGFVIKLTVM